MILHFLLALSDVVRLDREVFVHKYDIYIYGIYRKIIKITKENILYYPV